MQRHKNTPSLENSWFRKMNRLLSKERFAGTKRDYKAYLEMKALVPKKKNNGKENG